MAKIFTYGTKVYTDEDKLKEENMRSFLWEKEVLYPMYNEKTTPITEKITQIDENTIRHSFVFRVYKFGSWMRKQFTYLEKNLD
jgi:hypothetical protein